MSRRLLVFCALVAAVACAGSSAVAPSGPSLNGTWTLRTVNDAGLPYTLPRSPSNNPTTIRGATLTISGTTSGSYTELIDVRVVTSLRTIDTSLMYSGSWALNGSSITFNDKTFPEAYQGWLASNTIDKIVLFGYSGEYSR